MFPLTVAHVSTNALRHNLAAIRRLVGPQVQIWPAVKANAYGHGLRIVLDVLSDTGEVSGVSVANLEEAIYVRQQNWNAGVLILGPDVNVGNVSTRRAKLQACLDYDLEPTLTERVVADELAALVRERGEKAAAVHVKMDSGMHRLGLSAEEVIRLATYLRSSPQLRLASVYTHLAMADEDNPQARQITQEQLSGFVRAGETIAADGRGAVFMHAANSAGLMRFPEGRFSAVRPGVCLYGLSPFNGETQDIAQFQPVMHVLSRIVLVKHLPPGRGVGYGHVWQTNRDSVLGIVPIGYNDGYRRSWGGRTVMRAGGVYCPVVGRISMDSAILDLTGVPRPHVDMPVEVISSDPAAPNCVAALARLDGTIPYEITCLLGARVHRMPVEG